MIQQPLKRFHFTVHEYFRNESGKITFAERDFQREGMAHVRVSRKIPVTGAGARVRVSVGNEILGLQYVVNARGRGPRGREHVQALRLASHCQDFELNTLGVDSEI